MFLLINKNVNYIIHANLIIKGKVWKLQQKLIIIAR